MDNELALREEMTAVKADDKVFEDMTSSGFLPRLQLETAKSQAVNEGFPLNHYRLYKNPPVDIGTSVDITIIAWRPKALDTSGGELVDSYDPESELFAEIKERSFEKDSGCMYGPEFLVYIPDQKAYATFFCGSKSARRNAGALKRIYDGYMNKDPNVPEPNVTLGSEGVKTAKYSWTVFNCELCATPLDKPQDREEFRDVLQKFINPPKPDVQMKDSAAKTEER